MTSCINCGSYNTQDLLAINRMPVLCNDLHDSPELAREATCGRMDLVFCRCCGHYFNRSFQPALMYYSANYETSLSASDVFRNYADALVSRLVSTYNIRGKKILEIGCGRGEFLRHLCAAGDNQGIGFDTSTPVEGEDPEVPGVRYVRDYFSKDYGDIEADFIVCQQVLEHIENPREFLRVIVETATFQARSPVVYFEVPNGLYTAKELGIWDLIYEHISYFTPTSLRFLFENAGFEILSLRSAYGDQYLCVEARFSGRFPAISMTDSMLSKSDIATADAFAECFSKKLSGFKSWAEKADAANGRTYVWGAGSKGISFCNLVDPNAHIAGLIDRSMAKRGKYIACTGVGISRLEEIDPMKIVYLVVMNPQYAQEIEKDLRKVGCSVEIIDAMGCI